MATKAKSRFDNLEEILEAFDHIPARRIRSNPPPGTATETDWERLHEKNDRLYELVGGTLVEKVMGYAEGFLAALLIRLLGNFVEERDLGAVAGADAAARLMPGLIRVPDVSFIRWERFPEPGVVPDVAAIDVAPDLAIEVLSKSNTPREMQRKRKDYFLAGVRRVWVVDPKGRTVRVYTDPETATTFPETAVLTDEDLLPGFALPLETLFARLPKSPPAAKPKRRKK